jgi:purine-binding chemotaxis protein CheW
MQVLQDASPIEIVVFEVAGQRFGVRVAHVREIVRAATLSAAPGADPAIKGMLNLRGQIVAVFDVRAPLGLPAAPLEHTEHLIVTEVGGEWIALRTDRALDLVRLPAGAIRSAGSVVNAWEAVEGVAQVNGRLVLIVDPGRLSATGATRPALARGKEGP